MDAARRRLAAVLLAAAGWLGTRPGLAPSSATSNPFRPEVDECVPWNDEFRSFLQLSGTHLGDRVYGHGGLDLDDHAFPIVNLPFGQRKAEGERGESLMLRAGYNDSLSDRGRAGEPATNTIVVEGTGPVPLPAGSTVLAS